MDIINGYLVNELFNRTNRLYKYLRLHAAQVETYFIPVGVMFMKWIVDSKERFGWKVPNELRNMFAHSSFDNLFFNNNDGNRNIYRIAEELERNNSEFSGILTTLCFSHIDYVPPEYLRDIFIEYNNFEFNKGNTEMEVTGPFMELFLEELSNDSSSYEFITPKSIRQILARLFNIKEHMNVGDVVCGTSGILCEIVNEYQDRLLYIDKIKFYGQDINLKIALVGKLNLLLHGIRNPYIVVKDTLREPILYNNNYIDSFDILLSNLPLGVKWNTTEVNYTTDFKYCFPNNKIFADWMFIQRGIAALKPYGKAAFIVSKGTLTRNSEMEIRKQVLDDDIVETIIALPANLYGTKTMPIEILIINMNKEQWRRDKILFIDASKEYYKKERGKNDLSDDQVNKIVQTYNSWYEIDKYSKVVDKFMIEEQNYELDSSIYIDNKQLQITNQRMKKLREVSEIKRGLQLLKNDANKLTVTEEGSHYYIKISDIVDGKIQFYEKIKDIADSKIASYELKPGDIIISARGTLIKTAIYEVGSPPSVISGNIMLIRVKPNYNNYFLKFYLDSVKGKEQIQALQGGTTITALNHSKLQELLVPDIDLEVQNKLAERIMENERSYRSIVEHATRMYEQNLDIINKEIFDFIEN